MNSRPTIFQTNFVGGRCGNGIIYSPPPPQPPQKKCELRLCRSASDKAFQYLESESNYGWLHFSWQFQQLLATCHCVATHSLRSAAVGNRASFNYIWFEFHAICSQFWHVLLSPLCASALAGNKAVCFEFVLDAMKVRDATKRLHWLNWDRVSRNTLYCYEMFQDTPVIVVGLKCKDNFIYLIIYL
jgi:hypothetical protein